MRRSARTATPTGNAGLHASPLPAVRIPYRVAGAGLFLVVVVLTVFSVAVAVVNSRGTDLSQRSVAWSELYETAFEALIAQEESAEEFLAEDGRQARNDYAAADRATRHALQALAAVDDDVHGAGEVERLVATHQRYGVAVQAMFDAVESPESAELYEDALVDPIFDPLAATLAEHVKVRNQEAFTALASIAQAQRVLQTTTPALFGAGLLLLAIFMVMLARSRRLVVLQANENRHQSFHDGLTGLPNRLLLHLRGEFCLRDSVVTGTPVGLMLLDVDRFKQVNDTFGHHHGDLVLQAIAERLRLAVRTTDTVARLGGDEFAILLPQVHSVEAALEVAAKVQAALETSVDVGGVVLEVDVSIGVAISGAHGDDIHTLLQHVDSAMYQAKTRGLGVCVYDEKLDDRSGDQLGLLAELRGALDNDDLVLHFQPQIALSTGEFYRAEALLRWEHPTRGMIPPEMFIPAAEQTALIRPLTSWVINAALAECKRWQDQGRPLKLSVNISARNLLHPAFPDDIQELLQRWALPPSCLLLEVTESAIMADPDRAQSMLARFAAMGIELAIDDFGAGYTSVAQLGTLPVVELKIDQSLVAQMSVSARDALIVKGIIDLAHSLGLHTVAEGVPDAGTLQRLAVMGCDAAQGSHLARPMSAAQLRLWRTAATSAPIRHRRPAHVR